MSGEDTYTVARFWAKVDVSRPNECWTWRAAVTEDGYGVFRLPGGRSNTKAHRFAWALASGTPIDSVPVVRHRCDNPPCCNPRHLMPGTQAENVDDMVARGRQRGSRHSRLSSDQVDAIVASIEAGETQKAIAQRLGISQSYVSMIASGKRWRREEVA